MALTGPILIPVMDTRQIIASGNISMAICTNRQIRDTAGHDASNDALINVIDCRQFSGNKVLFVQNASDQNVTISIAASYDGVTNIVYGLGTSKTISGYYAGWFDPNSAPQLGYNYPYMTLIISYTVAPTAGGVSAYLMMRTA